MAASGSGWSYPFRDFLDGFYEHPSVDGLLDAPPLLAGIIPDGERVDAYLAGTAEHFVRQYGYRPPQWIFAESRYLPKPYFAAQTHNLRMILLEESPSAFRARNIFISANALTRA
jgi:hypothetical protein